jgi:hypothetical protein
MGYMNTKRYVVNSLCPVFCCPNALRKEHTCRFLLCSPCHDKVGKDIREALAASDDDDEDGDDEEVPDKIDEKSHTNGGEGIGEEVTPPIFGKEGQDHQAQIRSSRRNCGYADCHKVDDNSNGGSCLHLNANYQSLAWKAGGISIANLKLRDCPDDWTVKNLLLLKNKNLPRGCCKCKCLLGKEPVHRRLPKNMGAI